MRRWRAAGPAPMSRRDAGAGWPKPTWTGTHVFPALGLTLFPRVPRPGRLRASCRSLPMPARTLLGLRGRVWKLRGERTFPKAARALPGSPGATGPCGRTQGRDLLSRHQDACPIQASPRPRLGSCSGCRCLGQGHREGAHAGGGRAGRGPHGCQQPPGAGKEALASEGSRVSWRRPPAEVHGLAFRPLCRSLGDSVPCSCPGTRGAAGAGCWGQGEAQSLVSGALHPAQG